MTARKKKPAVQKAPTVERKAKALDAPKCGLCGKKKNLVRAECCGQWICNDEDKYVLFSYAENSCHRNHRRMTLCGYHHGERHKGKWQDCKACRSDFEPEMVVWYGTNEFNFEKMPDPPSFEPTRCRDCNVVIDLGAGGYSHGKDGYRCGKCTQKEFRKTASK